jgi:hypothetical protein
MTRAPTLARVASTLAGFTTLGKINPTGNGTTALTLPQHLGPVIDIRTCLADPEAPNADLTAALVAARTLCVTAGGGSIYIPPGQWDIDSAVTLTPSANVAIRIFGAGPGVTRIRIGTASTAIQCGNHSSAQWTAGLTFSDFSLIMNETPSGNPIFAFHNIQNVLFERVFTTGVTYLFEIGLDANTYSGDSVVNFKVSQCNFSGQRANTPLININSASTLWFDTCKFNGSGQASARLFDISCANKNVDGLWVTQCLAEQWACAFHCTGAGISNLVVLGGAYDRYTSTFGSVYLVPQQSGAVRNVAFIGVNLGVTATTIAGARIITLDGSTGTGADVSSITIAHCTLMASGAEAIRATEEVNDLTILGNTLVNCASDVGGGNILDIAAENCTIQGNTSKTMTGATDTPGVGIAWSGTPSPFRKSSGNNWTDVTDAQESGLRFDNTWNLEDYFVTGQRVASNVDISSAITRMISAIAASGLTSAFIDFPAGTMRQDAPIDWTALGLAVASNGMAITIRGKGRDCTTINYADLDDVCWNFGNHGTLTYKWTDITITGISFQQVGIPTADNAAMYFRNCRRVHLEQIGLYGFKLGLKLGDSSQSDSLHRFKLVNSYSEPSHLYTPYWFELGSGSAFEFINCTNNMPQKTAGVYAGTVSLFKCTNTASSIDGLRVIDSYMSQFDRYLDINNVRGIVNFWWIGGIYDRPTSGIVAYVRPSNEMFRWKITKVMFQGGDTAVVPSNPPNQQQVLVIDGSLTTSGRAITDLQFEGNSAFNLGGNVLEFGASSVRLGVVANNVFTDCGHNGNDGTAGAGTGKAIILINTGNSVVCTNNLACRNNTGSGAGTGYGPFTYTVSMPGASTPGRYRDTNTSIGLGTNVSGGYDAADTP